MGIEKHLAKPFLIMVVWFLLLMSGVQAGTTSMTMPSLDSVPPNTIERVDTIWIDDTVWVKDSTLLLQAKSAPVIDTNKPIHDSIALSANDTADIPELYTFTVFGKRYTGKDESVKPTIVRGWQIRESSRATPLEEISQESGDIYVTSKGTGLHGVSSGASGGIYIRGLGGSPNSQILVVEDGAPDYQGIFGHPIPDAFFPSLIDRMIVVKGGDGVLYGTNAMGGVIIVENRWPDSAGIRLENDAAYGSFNTFRERATLLSKGKNTEVVSAFSAFATDGHRDGTDGSSVAGQIGLRLHLPGQSTIALRDKIIHLEGGDPGPYFHPYTDHRFDVLRNSFSARLDYPGSHLHLTVVPWLNIGEHRLYDGFFSRDYTTGATAECSGSFIEQKLQIILGTAGEYVDGLVLNRITGIESPVEDLSNAGLYGQITIKPGMAFTGVCGGRLHFSNRYGTIPLYKAGLNWDPIEYFSLHTRLTKNFRQPTLRELYLPFPVANPNLRPEIAINWDAGAEVKSGTARLSGSVYKTWATDMIKYFGVWPSAEVVNIDQLEIQGIEGEFSMEHIGPFGAFITASWQDVGKFTKQNPDAKVNGRISYTCESKTGKLELSATGEWVHGLYMNNYKRDPLENVFFIDGSIRYRTHGKGGVQLEPYCVVRNLMNSQYQYIQYYPMPGINFLAGITIKV